MQKQINPKQDLAIRLRLYINHKRVLEKKCTTHYRDPIVAKSMRLVYDLFSMVKKDYCASHTLDQLCKMILQHEQNLRNILPRYAHTHYQKQLEKLDAILSDAKKLKQPININ